MNSLIIDISMGIKVEIQTLLFEKYLNLNVENFSKYHTGDYTRNLTTEAALIEGRFINPLLTILSEVIPLSFILVFLSYINFSGLFFASILIFVISYSVVKFTSKRLHSSGKLQLENDGYIVKTIKDSFSLFKENKLYKSCNFFTSIFNGYARSSANNNSIALKYGSLPKPVLEISGILAIGIFSFVSILNDVDKFTLATHLSLFAGAVVKSLPSANRISRSAQYIMHGLASLENIVTQLKQPDEKLQNLVSGDECFKSIVVKDLSYITPAGKRIFDNFNYCFEFGKFYTITGKSGIGKSTILDLILGFTKPSDGCIYLLNAEASKCPGLIYRREDVSFVPQNPTLITGSLMDNLCLGRGEFDVDYALKLFKYFSLNYLLGDGDNIFSLEISESGSSLSGGERQRISIIRALLYKPKILIMDEFTSALDKNIELQLLNKIRELTKNMLVINVSHSAIAINISDVVIEL